jgi:hypothetical protein
VALPTRKVELGLDLSAQGGPFFKLNDQAQGVLDNTTYLLGGSLFYDVTSYVKTLTTDRGRSRELDRYNTGSASVTFTNQSRAFDPSYTSSPFWPSIQPRREMRITIGGSAVYYGLVDDWNLDYQINGESTAGAVCVDGFAILAKQNLSAFTAIAGQTTGARIGTVLARSEVAWPTALLSLDAGQQTLQADVVAQDTNVLTYLQLVEQSEPGSFFISAAGSATFKDRNTAAVVGTATFADDGSGIGYTDLQVVYGTELLYNRVNITRAGGTVQTANYTPSQDQYSISTLDEAGLLIDTDANALTLANYLLGRYQQPELRFDQLTVELSSLTTAQQATVLGLELTNVITVKFTPNKVGSQVSQRCQIIGIAHDARPDSHKVTLKLAQTDGKVAFVLNSTAYGVLDTSTLGF